MESYNEYDTRTPLERGLRKLRKRLGFDVGPSKRVPPIQHAPAPPTKPVVSPDISAPLTPMASTMERFQDASEAGSSQRQLSPNPNQPPVPIVNEEQLLTTGMEMVELQRLKEKTQEGTQQTTQDAVTTPTKASVSRSAPPTPDVREAAVPASTGPPVAQGVAQERKGRSTTKNGGAVVGDVQDVSRQQQQQVPEQTVRSTPDTPQPTLQEAPLTGAPPHEATPTHDAPPQDITPSSQHTHTATTGAPPAQHTIDTGTQQLPSDTPPTYAATKPVPVYATKEDSAAVAHHHMHHTHAHHHHHGSHASQSLVLQEGPTQGPTRISSSTASYAGSEGDARTTEASQVLFQLRTVLQECEGLVEKKRARADHYASKLRKGGKASSQLRWRSKMHYLNQEADAAGSQVEDLKRFAAGAEQRLMYTGKEA